MRNTIIASSIIFCIGLIALLSLTIPRNEPPAESDTTHIAQRPNCPQTHITLPCLGADIDEREPAPITIVNLWAWWCAPCRDELPLFDELAAQNPQWDVIGVHADPNAANGAAMLNDLNIQIPSYQDSDNTFAAGNNLPNVVPITIIYQDGQQKGVLARAFTDYEDLTTSIGEIINS
ncbi:MAG: TlpA disulfide reductase family protein [Corynebacterium sp.]|uniref:TlpA family protein disulfide reductase n=1 Tax=Corynebacterium sp. TaxID=1720 RepID=UPI0026DC7E95|nr:TlpA disulfide reductase family protein [Corynebacterium sp.]MDO5099093.1 TlpA disulfide reductase family protein [Corynebacterium sp.]